MEVGRLPLVQMSQFLVEVLRWGRTPLIPAERVSRHTNMNSWKFGANEMTAIKNSFCAALFLVVGIAACTLPRVANAEGRCPPGQYPVGRADGVQGCAPIPGGAGEAAQSGPIPTGRWIKTWGAVAIAKGGDVGVALGKQKKTEASSESIANCAQHGARDCQVVLSFKNQCAAVVSPSDGRLGGSTFARAVSIEVASATAMDICTGRGSSGCRVIYSGCTEPIFEKF